MDVNIVPTVKTAYSLLLTEASVIVILYTYLFLTLVDEAIARLHCLQYGTINEMLDPPQGKSVPPTFSFFLDGWETAASSTVLTYMHSLSLILVTNVARNFRFWPYIRLVRVKIPHRT